MTVSAKITSKGQITLPKKVRDILHLHEGGVVVFEQEENKFVIKPAESLLDYKGYLKGRAKHADADSVRETARTYIGRKAGKRRDRP
jgi:AbrB family looped-hinge helix DNA binding protein